MKTLYSYFVGIIIGFANIIPGLSGATLAVSLGAYEKIIESLNNIKKNIVFLLVLGLGIISGILIFAKGLEIAFYRYELWFICFFIGLILGGVPSIYRKTSQKLDFKNIITFSIAFAAIIMLNQIDLSTNGSEGAMYLVLLLVGFVSASAMIIPGLSGAFILIVFGQYNFIIATINNLTKPELFIESATILFFLALGIILGIIVIAKLIKQALLRYQTTCYMLILGIIIASAIVLFIPLLSFSVVFYQAFTALLLIDLGFFITYLLGEDK